MNEESAWLNEEKNLIGKKMISRMSASDMSRVVSLGTNNLSIRVCESGEKSCLLRLFNDYSLSRSSSNGFTLWLFNLSVLFPH